MKTTTNFLKMKQEKEPIVMVTAYDYPTARLVEEAKVDMILVGDSLGMVVLGYDSTVSVTVAEMLHHAKAVRRGATNTFVVLDMPFMSYHVSLSETMKTARQMMQETGANALKLEGADEVVPTISALTKAGVPVVAHLGLTPQSVGVLGGYKVQGKDEESAKKLVLDALAVQEAGAMALVLECVPQQLASHISSLLEIPTIGIGAGIGCDGQVLVFHDLVGYGTTDWVPSFVKQYTKVSQQISESIQHYAQEVKARSFPTEKHSFNLKDENLLKLYGGQ